MKKITKIEQQKKNKSRYSIFINEEYSFSVSEDAVVRYSLAKNMELDDDFLEDILKAEEQNKANGYGLKLLSYRGRSEKEIRDKMREKGYELEIVKKTIEFLKEYDYINDSVFAENFIKDRINIKKLGEKRLSMELSQKGVDKEISKKLLDEIIDEEDEYNRALQLAQKKVENSYKNDDRNGKYRKLSGFLQRKGYSYGVVSMVLKEVIK